MIGQQQTATQISFYYVLLQLLTAYSTQNGKVLAADSNICVEVLTEKYKPDADVIIGVISSLRSSSSDCNLCDNNTDAVIDVQTYKAAKIIVDHPPPTVLLPNISIGLEFYDDCGTPLLDSQAALHYAILENKSPCATGQLRPGVIGPMLASSVSAAASVLDAVHIPLVSLSKSKDRTNSSNVLRILPSASNQAQVVVDLAEHIGWNYISIVTTRDPYNLNGAKETRRLAAVKSICTSETLLLEASVTDDSKYDDIITELLSNSEAKGVILWCSSRTTRGLLRAIERRKGNAYDLIFFSTDNTISDDTVMESDANAARGLIGIRPFSDNMAAFKYLHQFSTETFDNLNSIPVIDAVLTFEHALASVHQEKCAGSAAICSQMTTLSGQEMIDHMKTTTFSGISGNTISFDSNGELNTFTYEIVQYQSYNSTQGLMYSFQKIGVWRSESGLMVNGSFLHYTQYGLVDWPPASNCGNSCGACIESRQKLPSENRGDNYMRIPGDLDIPVILSLSEPAFFGMHGLRCGHVREQEVLSSFALLYAMDKVNADPEVFPNVKLGITVMDSCGQSVIATRQLAGVVGQTTNLEASGMVLGILGPDNDDVANKIVTEITDPAGFVTIGLGNSPSALESSNFFQVTPSLNDQVRAIAVLLAKLDWFYTGVIYSSSAYGSTGFETFRLAAKEFGICLGPTRQIPKDAVQPDFDIILADMYSTKELNIIVTFVESSDARRLLVTEHLYAYDRFSWVGTETWTIDSELFSGFEHELLGTVVVVPSTGNVTEFQQYLSDVPIQYATTLNPWLVPALSRIFPCNTTTRIKTDDDPSLKCVDLGSSGLGTLITKGEYTASVTHIINAFYALAYAADQLREMKCANQNQTVCDEFLQTVRSHELYEAVANMSFYTSINGQKFTFKNKSGPAEFTVNNFQQLGVGKQLLKVGTWSNGNMTLNSTILQLANLVAEKPQRDPLRCGLCFEEPGYEEPNEILHWELHYTWVYVILSVSALGLFLVLCTFCIFSMNRSHPVVTSSSFSLSLWLLLGLAMMYCMNLAYMLHANTTICSVRRVGTSLAYAVTFSALSVKSIRINRIVRCKPGESMSFLGSWSQSLLFCVFISTQFFVSAAWLLLQRPNANAIPGELFMCEGQENLWTCDYSHLELTISLTYVYALMFFTCFTSVLALRYPYFLNEGKFIFMCSLASIVILVAWLCVYTLAQQDIAIPGLCIGMTINATVIFVAMFLPKCTVLGEDFQKSLNDKLNRDTGLVNEKDETTGF